MIATNSIGKRRMTAKYVEELYMNLKKQHSIPDNYDQLSTEYKKELLSIYEQAKEQNIVRIEIDVQWNKNKTWGNCPKASAFIRYDDGSVEHYQSARMTGSGYSKESAAIAEALNKVAGLRKKMLEIKYQHPDKKNRDIFGYGSGYSLIPYFEEGAGTESLISILKFLGYKMVHEHHPDAYDFYVFELSNISETPKV